VRAVIVLLLFLVAIPTVVQGQRSTNYRPKNTKVTNGNTDLYSFVPFVALPAACSEADDGPCDERDDPVATLASYFNAINARDYRRAYGYYESPPSSYEQFARGFTDTDSVRFLIEPPRKEGAAGSIYAAIPTVIVSTLRGGNERVFAGCYVMRRSNVRDRGWQIYRADVSQFPASSRISRLLSQRCR